MEKQDSQEAISSLCLNKWENEHSMTNWSVESHGYGALNGKQQQQQQKNNLTKCFVLRMGECSTLS